MTIDDVPRAPAGSAMPAPLSRESVAERLRGELLLAPLTRGGNLPFRRTCCDHGARWTFSEMALAKHLARRSRRELALLRRHESEEVFGVQVAAREPEIAVKGARVAVDSGAQLIDVNAGCPIRPVVRRGEGSALLEKPRRLERLLRGLREALDVPLFLKIRTGAREGRENAVAIARLAEDCGVDALTVHGRTREQRYRRPADWDRIAEVAASVSIPVVGNGDLLHASEVRERLETSGCTALMAARGALVKPWLWADVAAGQDRPRSAEERLAIYRRWVEHGLERWGADEIGWRRLRGFLEFHVDWWRRYVPEDAAPDGGLGMQERASFEPRDELERVLLAEGPDGIDRACRAILESFDAPPEAVASSGAPLGSTSEGWG